MDVTKPVTNPSRTFHAMCAYWLTSSDGFNANARGQIASVIHNAIAYFKGRLRRGSARIIVAPAGTGASRRRRRTG
jgi:hypothetical protein